MGEANIQIYPSKGIFGLEQGCRNDPSKLKRMVRQLYVILVKLLKMKSFENKRRSFLYKV